MTIEQAIQAGKKAHARAEAKQHAVLRRDLTNKCRIFSAHCKNAKRWVNVCLPGKIKYRASRGEHKLDLDDEGIPGTKINFIPAEAKYHVIYFDTEFSKTIKARFATRYDVRDYDEQTPYDRTDYWVEWDK